MNSKEIYLAQGVVITEHGISVYTNPNFVNPCGKTPKVSSLTGFSEAHYFKRYFFQGEVSSSNPQVTVFTIPANLEAVLEIANVLKPYGAYDTFYVMRLKSGRLIRIDRESANREVALHLAKIQGGQNA